MNLRKNVLKAPNYLSAVITFFFFFTEKKYRGHDLGVLNGSYGPDDNNSVWLYMGKKFI